MFFITQQVPLCPDELIHVFYRDSNRVRVPFITLLYFDYNSLGRFNLQMIKTIYIYKYIYKCVYIYL